MKKRHLLITAVLSMGLLAACAEKGPIQLTISYQTPADKTASASKTVVAVSPLKDGRGKPASVLGMRTIPNGQQNDLVVPGAVAEMVTANLKQAFRSRGIVVKDAPDWSLIADDMKFGGADILIGGEITTLWIESKASPFKTNLQSSVKLKIVAGDIREKKIIRTIDVNSTLEQDVLYSRDKMEQTLSEALSAAIDQIFSDEELKKRLQ
jgi:uncharacterized lipoprotein YajG